MPRIRFFESDNTGSTPVSDFAGVFVPGTAPFVIFRKNHIHLMHL